MPVSEGGGWVIATGTDGAVPSVLTGVGPDKPAAGPAPEVSAEALRGGYDWGADSKIRPGMSDAEKTAAIAAGRKESGVPSRFRAPPTVADLPRARDPLDDVDGLLGPLEDDSLAASAGGQVEAEPARGGADAAVTAPSRPLAPTAPARTPSQAVQAGADPVTPSGGPAPAPVSAPAPRGHSQRGPRQLERYATIVRLHADGTSLSQIVRRVGCGWATVYKALAQAGVDVQPRTVPRSVRGPDYAMPVRTGYEYPPGLVEQVRRLYLVEGLSQAQVGERVGHSQVWVSALMRRAGIERRRPGARKGVPHRRPAPPPAPAPLERAVAALADFPWQQIYEQLDLIAGRFGTLADLVAAAAEHHGISIDRTPSP